MVWVVRDQGTLRILEVPQERCSPEGCREMSEDGSSRFRTDGSGSMVEWLHNIARSTGHPLALCVPRCECDRRLVKTGVVVPTTPWLSEAEQRGLQRALYPIALAAG